MAIISDEYITVFSAQFNELSQAESALRSMRTQIEQNNGVLRSFDGEIATARGQMAELVGRMNDLRQAGQGNSQAFKDLQAQYQGVSAAARGLSAEKRNLTLEAKNLKDEETKAAASVKELDAALRKQIATAETSKITFDKVKTAVSDLSSGMMRAGGLISGFVTAPIAAITEMGRSFESTLRQVAANTAMTDAQLSQMRDTIIGMGRNTSASMDDLAKGYMHVTNFGFEAADATRILDAAMKDAVATGTQTEAVANTLAGVLHEFGLSGGEASNVMNTLALAAAHGNLTLEQFTSVSGRVFSTAANLGLSLNEAAAAMSALTRAGFPAEQASTQLVGALTHLVNPAGQAKDEIKALSKATGIDLVHDFSQAGLQSKGLSGVLADLKLAIGDNTAEALKLFGGIRGGLGVMALIGNAQKDYTQLLRETSDTMAGKLSPTTEAYNREVQSLGFQFGELKNRLTILGDALNNAFSGTQINFIRSLSDAVDALARGFTALDPTAKAAIATFLGAFAIGGPILLGVGALVTLIGGPLTLAIAGISLVLSVMVADWTEGMQKSSQATFTARDAVLGIAKALGFLMDVVGAFGHSIAALTITLIAPFDAIAHILKGDVMGAFQSLDTTSKAAAREWNLAWDDVNAKWGIRLTNMVNQGFAAAAGFGAAGAAAGNAFSANLSRALAKTKLPSFNFQGRPFGASTLTDDERKSLSSAIDEAERTLGIAGKKAGETGGKAIADGITGGIKGGHGKIKAAVDETFAAVTDWMRSANLGDLSKSVWDKLAQSVKSALKSQADEFHESKDELQTYKANIIALMDGLGFEVIKANNAIGVSFKQSADVIATTSAQVGTSIRGITEGIGPAFDQLQRDSAAATVGLVADSQRRVENYNAEQKAADDSFRSLAAHVESMGHDIPEGLRKITDGFVMMSGKTGEAMLLMLQKVRGWGHDVVQVIETLPGKFGDVARGILKTVDQWIVFFDRVLQLAHRFSSSIPESIEAAISKIIGLFKTGQSSILDSGGFIIKNLQSTFIDATSTIGESLGHSIGGAAASVEGLAKSAGTGIGQNITSGLSSFLSSGIGIAGAVIGALALFTSTFQSSSKAIRFAGGAALGGLLGGFLSMFLGGPSELQKAQMAAQLQQARDAIKLSEQTVLQAIETTKQSMLNTATAVLNLAPLLNEMEGVSKAQIRKLFVFMNRIVNGFLEAAKQWVGVNVEQTKQIAEMIGSVFGAIAQIPAAATAINSTFSVSDSQIDLVFNILDRIIARWSTLADQWIGGASKRIRKVAERLGPAIDLISPLIQAIKDSTNLTEPGDEQFGIIGRVLDKIINMVGSLADKYEKPFLKALQNLSDKVAPALDLWKADIEAIKASVDLPKLKEEDADNAVSGMRLFIDKLIANFADFKTEGLGRVIAIATAITPVAAALKSWAEATAAVKDYTKVAADTWTNIADDFQRAKDLILMMLASAIDFLPKAIQFEDVMKQIADHLKAGLASLGEGLSAAASAFGGVVNAIQGGAPPGTVLPGGGSFAPSFAGGGATASTHTTTIHLNIDGRTVGGSSDPRVSRAVRDLLDLLGVGGGLDSTIAQHS